MNKFKKVALAAAIASAAIVPVASQAAVVIDGVAFNAGAQFIATTVWESVLVNVTDTLEGVGRINSIECTSSCGGLIWSSKDNDTTLSYYFSGYSVAAWYDSTFAKHISSDGDFASGFGAAVAIDFSGGNIKVYSDRFSTGTNLNPSGSGNVATDIADATDGNLWLEYAGATTSQTDGFGVRTGTLFSTATGLNNVHTSGTGLGYLDVLGGLAASNFDTDSYNVFGTVTDAKLTSSFSTSNSGAWPLSGTADIKTAAIPEPASLALLGLGLLGVGATYRRKAGKKA